MRPRHRLYLAEALFGAALALSAPGCTVLFPAMTASRNAGLPPDGVVTPDGAFVALPGARLRLLLADSTVVAGRFVGAEELPAAEAGPRYLAWRDARAPELPRPGDEVTLTGPWDAPVRGRFASFGWHEVRLDPRGPARRRAVGFGDFDTLRGPAGVVASARLAALRLARELPTTSALRVELDRDPGDSWLGPRRQVTIPADDVREVRVHHPRGSERTALLAGVLLDVGVVLAIMNMPEPEPGCATPDLPPGWPLAAGLEPLEGPFDARAGRVLPVGGGRAPARAAPRR